VASNNSPADQAGPTKGIVRLLSWAGLWLAVSLLIFLIARSRLPAEVAIHWNASGQPDGSAPTWAIPLAAAGSRLIGLLLTLQFRIGREPSMEAFAIVGMMGGLGVAITALTVMANWDVADWTMAQPLSLWSFLALFAITVGGLGTGIVLGRSWYPIKDLPRVIDDEVTEIAPGERVSWVGRARVRRLALALLALGVVLLVVIPDLPLWVFAIVVGIGLVMTQVEANVTNDGVSIRLGGIPIRRIGLDKISSARAIDLDPTEWGGWGYRFSSGRSAIVLRSGEALEITFHDGRRFAVTVDEAATGSSLLNGLLESEWGTSG
jgi:hypothetical protein